MDIVDKVYDYLDGKGPTGQPHQPSAGLHLWIAVWPPFVHADVIDVPKNITDDLLDDITDLDNLLPKDPTKPPTDTKPPGDKDPEKVTCRFYHEEGLQATTDPNTHISLGLSVCLYAQPDDKDDDKV